MNAHSLFRVADRSIQLGGRPLYSWTSDKEDRRETLIKAIRDCYAGDYRLSVIDDNGLLHLAVGGLVLRHHRDILKEIKGEYIGAVIASRSGCLTTDQTFVGQLSGRRSPRLFVQSLPNIAYSQLANCFGLRGEHLYLLQEDPNWDQLTEQADLLLRFGQLRACLCGWIEAGTGPFAAEIRLLTTPANKPAPAASPTA